MSSSSISENNGRPTINGRSASAFLWDRGDATVDVESGLSAQVANAEEGQESSGSHRKPRKCNPALVVLNLVLAGALVATIFVMRDYGSDHGELPEVLERVEVPESVEIGALEEQAEMPESSEISESTSFDTDESDSLGIHEGFEDGESKLIVAEIEDQEESASFDEEAWTGEEEFLQSESIGAEQSSSIDFDEAIATFDEEAWTDEEEFLQSEAIEAEEESSGSFDDRDSQFEFTTWTPGEEPKQGRKAHDSAGFDVANGDAPPAWYINWREEFQKGE